MERNIIEHINDARRDLDFFNWEVAKFRAEHGMSPKLVTLYAEMKELDENLLLDIEGAQECYDMLANMYKELRND